MDLSKLRKEAPKAYQKIKQLRDEVLKLSQGGDESIKYTLEQLNKIVAALKTIQLFAKENAPKLLMQNKKTLSALNTLIEEKLKEIGHIDLNQIEVTGKAQCAAAKALLTVFNTLRTLMPHEQLNTAHETLSQKISEFQAAGRNPIAPESIQDYATLNEYIKHELKLIAELDKNTQKLACYQALDAFIRTKSANLNTPKPKGNLKSLRLQLALNENSELLKKIEKKVSSEKKSILTEFKASLEKFSSKHNELIQRARSIDFGRAVQTYQLAIDAGGNLLYRLRKAQDDFEKSDNLARFQKKITTILEKFEGNAFFKQHRAHPLVVKYLIEPFEHLKRELDKIFDWEWTKPSQTKTTKTFDSCRKTLLVLTNSKDEPNPKGPYS